MNTVISAKERIFGWIDTTSFGRFVTPRSQSFTALNNVVADLGYLLYAIFSNGGANVILLIGTSLKITGSTMLLADDRKGAEASREGGWPSRIVLILHHCASAITHTFETLLPMEISARLPNSFSTGFMLYASNGSLFLINGIMRFAANPSLMGVFQSLAGISITTGALLYAVSGLVKSGELSERWRRRAEVVSAFTALFNLFNFTTSLNIGILLVASMNFFQIYVRQNLRHQP